jgi:DNA-binding transcriptional LysR family regulator
MNIDDIRDFIEFCKHMNFTKAADGLNTTQPALSYRIASLEKKLGVQLVERGKTIRLTAAGASFFEDVTPIIAQLNKAIADCKAKRDLPTYKHKIIFKRPPLSMGTVNALFRTLLAGFKQDNPDVETAFAPESNTNFIDDMIERRCDCALSYSFDGDATIVEKYNPERAEALRATSIEFVPILELPLTVIFEKDCPLASKDPLFLKDIDGFALPYAYEARFDELLYAFETHCRRYHLNIELRPKVIDYSGLDNLRLKDNELLVSAPDYPLTENLVRRELAEKPTQYIHVAVNTHDDNPALKLFVNYLRKNTCCPGANKAAETI